MKFGGRRPPFPDAELIRTLAAVLTETGLTEIEYAIGDRRIRIARAPTGPAPASTPTIAAASPAAASEVARRIQMPAAAASYAARLYAVLHELDAENLPWIAVELPPETPEWAAIRDRLMRAAGR